MMGGWTSKPLRVCVVSHNLDHRPTSYWSNSWWHGASANASSPHDTSGSRSCLCWQWTILVLTMRENKVLNTSLMHSPITMKLPLTGLASFFVGCHSSGITCMNDFICPCLHKLQNLCTASNMPHHHIHTMLLIDMNPSNMAPIGKQPQSTCLPHFYLLTSSMFSKLWASSSIILGPLIQPW